MTTNDWGSEALLRFPDLENEWWDVSTPYQLWFELRSAFEKAYAEPRNDDLIRRIYEFAHWCCAQPAGETAADDLGTCVCVCFYEHIPEIEPALLDMPRWFTRDDVVQSEQMFSYMVGKHGFSRILQVYDSQR